MVSYNTYPHLPSALPEVLRPRSAEAPPQVAYHLNVVQANRQGLKAKEQMFKKKYEKYTKILSRLTWLNACSSGISIATGISSVATFVTIIGIPVSTALGAASMTGAIASGIISMLTKKYQQKLKKVTKLIDIITPALVAFEMVVSGALKNGVIDEEELNMLQALYLKTLNKLTAVDHREKPTGRDKRAKKMQEQQFNCLLAVLFRVLLLKWTGYTTKPNHLWKGKKAVKKLEELSGEKPKVIKQWLS